MAKKKRCKKIVVYIAREGDREEYLLNYLQEIFDPEKNIQLKYSQEKGGNSNAILDRALKNAYYPKVYAWFDEDDQLDEEHRIELAKRWNTDTLTADIMDKDLQHYNKKMRYPIVVVSNPYSVEAVLIRLFDKNLPELINPVKNQKDFEENKKRMKSSVKGFICNMSDIEYYRQNLTKEQILKKATEIEELRLLLTIFGIQIYKNK